MAIMSRASGGGWPKIPYGLDQFILALPYLLFYSQIGLWVIPAYFSAVLALRSGHGRGFDYHLPFKPGSEPEKVEILIPDSLPVKYQKMLIMALTGLAVTVLPAILLVTHSFWLCGTVLALSGALKFAAYFLPRTDWAELTRGLALGCGVYFGLMLT